MIRFVDLNTGNTFDGSQPYVFWLDGEQSINLIYSKPICFISNSPNVKIGVEENEVFYLIDPKETINAHIDTIYGFEYMNINQLKKTELVSEGVNHHNYFVHLIYFIGSAKSSGEYIVDFNIDGEVYKLGGDFYGENEELYINLSNNGVELPECIQKALYDVNVHEEKRDNIVLNRKWKELLSNFWDVVANKGSYKSLYNSLKWFEYGDKLRLCELWKDSDTGRYFEKDIQEMLSDKFFDSMSGFSKTTYLSLYHSLEKLKVNNGKIELDEEHNPILEKTVSKWSTQDLALKLCMLGNFYETYFMPIHLDLIHSTIEDVVYTNTFKLIGGSTRDRSDFFYFCEDVLCNVKDGDTYKLNKVDCSVGPETLFGASSKEYEQNNILLGVQKTPVKILSTNEDWEKYTNQTYSEIGSVVDFNIQIPLLSDEYIKRGVLVFKTFDPKNKEFTYITKVEQKILGKEINFSLFCPIEGEYEVRIQFDSNSGKVFTKRVRFNVIDTNSVSMKIYKIYNLQTLSDCDLGQPSQINDYIYSRRKHHDGLFAQYIPAKVDNLHKSGFGWTGVCLNHMIILNRKVEDIIKDEYDLKVFKQHYFIKYKQNGLESDIYTVCVSKVFGFSPEDNINVNRVYIKSLPDFIYKEDYIFVPEFHKLVELDHERNNGLEDIKYYTITDRDALCVVPDLSYGKYIKECDWEFINVSKPFSESIKLNYIKEPFITNVEKTPLEPGYYDIKFNYRLTNDEKINTIVLNSAFRKI